ncbi:MAG: preprotein translocase subunit SecA [Candidatus Campbellbacteria bacterium]|nr:preprotein translocase subunit SecA [Candidatus Campbellbacteria bacterium]
MGFLDKIFGGASKSSVSSMKGIVEKVNNLEDGYRGIKKEDARTKIKEFKEFLKKGGNVDDILPNVFALVREASRQTLNQRHFDVQLMGGIALHKSSIAEMRTGEGKTLVATLAVTLKALFQKGVHLITVNDYLARRDAVWMGQIYSFLGLSVGVINDRESYLYDEGHYEKDKTRDTVGSFKVVYDFLRPVSRRDAYMADITYGTNNQFAFDYLRDNIAYTKEDVCQRGFFCAVVDEIDSILIDEARSPLIISTPAPEGASFYATFAKLARSFNEGEDYEIDEKVRAVSMTPKGIEKAEKALGFDNLYSEGGAAHVHHLENALRAKALFIKDKEYVVRSGSAIIVDEFTGRLQPGRRWSDGLHQAIEAKEGLSVQKETRTFASITFQNYFRMYENLSGMTGTATQSSEEFYKVYGLEVVSIPTHRPVARKDYPDAVYKNEESKMNAIVKEVGELNKRGQPVLIGTTSIEKNEMLSSFLSKAKIQHKVLNAKNHEEEGEIIAQAGRKGAVTIATNLAGRGVDIKLGGNPVKEQECQEVKDLGGLFVIGTERHEARRIDDQLRGRTGRQGDKGASRFFVSLDDSLMRIFGGERVQKIVNKLSLPDDLPIESGILSRSIEGAQRKIEGHYFDARRNVLQYDQVLDKHRNDVYENRRMVLYGQEKEVEDWVERHKQFAPEIVTNIEAKKEELKENSLSDVLKGIILRAIDFSWIEHLEAMERARSSVSLRSYGQREPIVEYKQEAADLFKSFEKIIATRVANAITKIQKKEEPQEEGDKK